MTKMKKAFVILGLLAIVALTSGCKDESEKYVSTDLLNIVHVEEIQPGIDLPEGEKVVSASWAPDNNYAILCRKRKEGEIAETYILRIHNPRQRASMEAEVREH